MVTEAGSLLASFCFGGYCLACESEARELVIKQGYRALTQNILSTRNHCGHHDCAGLVFNSDIMWQAEAWEY